MPLAESIKGTIGKLADSYKKKNPPSEKPKMKHVGFKGAQKSVESEGYSKKIAGAIIASSSRNASKAAKKANPNLNKVK